MIRKTLFVLSLLLISGCTLWGVTLLGPSEEVTSLSSPTSHPTPTAYGPPPIPSQLPEPTPVPPKRTNWLLLGGDYRAHRAGTDYGNKTDVIVLVSVLETDPIQITMIQYPRNLYIPIPEMDDQWLFAVYLREGVEGVHYYWQQAFDVDLNGIFYINMDGFVKLVDDLGGLKVPVSYSSYEPMNGIEVLAYLRDNDNNWNWGGYDKEQRSLTIVTTLAHKVEDLLVNEPFILAGVFFDRWHGLVTTDLADISQVAKLISLGWKAKTDGYDLKLVQLEEPNIVRADTPLEVRGMIPATDLSEWHRQQFGGEP